MEEIICNKADECYNSGHRIADTLCRVPTENESEIMIGVNWSCFVSKRLMLEKRLSDLTEE